MRKTRKKSWKMRLRKKTMGTRMRTTTKRMRKTMMKKMLMDSQRKAKALAKKENQRQHLANYGIKQ
jgi:hypothetical protein